MNAARKDAITAMDLPVHGEVPSRGPVRTQLLHEALDTLLSPATRDEVLATAGWDDEADAPADPSLAPVDWVDTKLFPRLVDRAGLAGADEARRHIRRLLKPASERPGPAVEVDAPPAQRVSRSGVRVRRPRRGSGTQPTMIPRPSGSTILALCDEDATIAALGDALGDRAELVVVRSLDDLTAMLGTLEDRLSMVLLDRRGRGSEELRALPGDSFLGHQVVMWGVRSLDTPDLQRLLQDAERSIGCTAEADLRDVSDLCAALLGLAGL
ncbi:MAG TPA: hypothetical protein RMH99_07400 [Sandaracinaceae bacterium LLY-WYZ-13_1]|nr:hypothetical protein [Sandaracinaceae bacterium LLY-WYZ-13_1]